MYHHQRGLLASHEALLMDEKLKFSTFNTEDHSMISMQCQVRASGRPEFDLQFFDHSTASHPSNVYYFPDGFPDELPADSASVESTILSDPSMRGLIYSLPNDQYGEFLHGRPLVGGLEESFGFERPLFDSMRQLSGDLKGGKEKGSFKTEKQRRERFSMKYLVLKSLIPNQTKPDRATIVADTIDYINELLRTVKELKILVEKKRRRRGCNNKHTMMDKLDGDTKSTSVKPAADGRDCDLRVSLRSSWLQRKSIETLVDVRIIEDEVYIKLTQRKMFDSLLVISKVLDELQLQLVHLSGGNIGDCHIFMFSTKIYEGSSVYASAIANKIIEAMDLQHQKLTA